MNRPSLHRRRVSPAWRRVALAASLLVATSLAHATNYDEVVQGDLSNRAHRPTDIHALTPGINRISGTTIPSGTFNPDTHALSDLDDDYVTFTVPTGYELASLFLGRDSIIEPDDLMFMGIARGRGVSVNPSFTSASGLLGWTLVGAAMVGTDLLPALGESAPAGFGPVGGATGFTGPLGSGRYTLWFLDGDSPAGYDVKLDVVPAVPEPETWALMLSGLAVTAGLVRRRGAQKSR